MIGGVYQKNYRDIPKDSADKGGTHLFQGKLMNHHLITDRGIGPNMKIKPLQNGNMYTVTDGQISPSKFLGALI